MRARSFFVSVVCAAFGFGLVACGEINQSAKTEKIYAGKKDEHAYDGKMFGGDKAKWETAMAQRSRTQNEYLRTDKK